MQLGSQSGNQFFLQFLYIVPHTAGRIDGKNDVGVLIFRQFFERTHNVFYNRIGAVRINQYAACNVFKSFGGCGTVFVGERGVKAEHKRIVRVSAAIIGIGFFKRADIYKRSLFNGNFAVSTPRIAVHDFFRNKKMKGVPEIRFFFRRRIDYTVAAVFGIQKNAV